MPEFPTDVRAFTVRLRRQGAWRTVFAPAGGLGWSKPCCEDGHDSEQDAAAHGGHVLNLLLSRSAIPA